MGLHRLAAITIGVPNVEDTARYYDEFGLARRGDGFSTRDGGEQLRLVERPTRRLVELCVAADDPDDLDRVTRGLEGLGIRSQRDADRLSALEVHCGVRAIVRVLPRALSSAAAPATTADGPHQMPRRNERAPAVLRDDRVRPRRLGHVVLGTPAPEASRRFFVDGLGFKVSDEVRDTATFLRCSTDHHNLLLQHSPIAFLHHSSWEVDDVDEVGRGATRMLEGHPERHVWGLGRHFLGSNFFWYLRDPAGNFSEYYSDMDAITDDQLWTPGTWEPSLRALYAWGPEVPASMLEPEDLAALMTQSHSP